MRRIGVFGIVILVCASGLLRAEIPAQISHQGVVAVDGQRFTGTGNFYFALIAPGVNGVNLWTNDGSEIGTTNRPIAPLGLGVVNGVYSVALGQSPMAALPSTVFENDDVLLRIWFDDQLGHGVFQLSPDQRLASAPFVYRALDSDRAAEAEHALEADHALDSDTVGQYLPRQLVPAGAMLAYGGAAAPDGWLVCDGSTVSRATFADLFASIGTAYGSGDGSTTFHLPDMRGRFLRGVSGATSNDPNRTQRTASNSGGNTGNIVGSLQADATSRPNSNFSASSVSNHTHSISSVSSHSHSSSGGSHQHFASMRRDGNNTGFPSEPEAGTGSFLGLLNIPSGGSHSHSIGSAGGHAHSAGSGGGHGHTINSGGDAETRPANVYVNWIIKH